MFVDGEGVEAGGVEGFAAIAHGHGEPGEFLAGEAVLEDGHQGGSDLSVGNAIVRGDFGGCLVAPDGVVVLPVEDDGVDEVLDLLLGEGGAVALFADDVDRVDGVARHCFFCFLTLPELL